MFLPRLLLALLSLFPYSLAIKFLLPASHNPSAKCIWNWATSDNLVIISANVDLANAAGISTQEYRDKMRIDMEVIDGSGSRNVYQSKRGLKGETRMAITTHADADLGVCFKNWLDASVNENQADKYQRAIDLDVDIGADAVDYNAIAKQESLSGLEVEMRKLEEVVGEIVNELNYLKRRETKMRDTNESTNDRVRVFSTLTMVTLVLLGVWQIFHLRSYFKRKYLID
ncbi:hypothetical protein BT69DRAFT_1267648 [Atractiella rhizophila]|nr:hypothetical protein BT69DRAFT_1267648 [Atractiella rhizophila]